MWQDSDGSFNPSIVDIFGTVFQPNGGSFYVPNNWDARLHIGWIRGTIYACDEVGDGAGAVALRKTNQGGYRAVASGTVPGGDLDLINAYSRNGIVNCNYKTSSGNTVTMRIIQAEKPTAVSMEEHPSILRTTLRQGGRRGLVLDFDRNNLAPHILSGDRLFAVNGRHLPRMTRRNFPKR